MAAKAADDKPTAKKKAVGKRIRDPETGRVYGCEPSVATDEVVHRALDYVRDGHSVQFAAKQMGVLKQTLWKALASPQWQALYDDAREERALVLAEETLEIADQDLADPVALGRAKLRVDTRKWFASRMDPRRWGDKVQHDVNPIQVNVTANFGD